jgi:hypothetical protein
MTKRTSNRSSSEVRERVARMGRSAAPAETPRRWVRPVHRDTDQLAVAGLRSDRRERMRWSGRSASYPRRMRSCAKYRRILPGRASARAADRPVHGPRPRGATGRFRQGFSKAQRDPVLRARIRRVVRGEFRRLRLVQRSGGNTAEGTPTQAQGPSVPPSCLAAWGLADPIGRKSMRGGLRCYPERYPRQRIGRMKTI